MRSSSRLLAVFLCLVVACACFAQGGGGRQRGNRQRNNFGLTSLIYRADVQTDLALTDDEKTKLDGMRESFRPQRGAGGGGGGTPPTREEMLAREQANEKQIDSVLTPDQSKRLREIQIQLEGVQAISRKQVQTDLGLSADQISKIDQLNKDFREANTSIREKVRNNEITREDAQASTQKNTQTLKDGLSKILTADQQTKLTAMGGKPFTPAATPAAGN